MTPRRVQVWFQNKRAKERRITKSMISEQPGSPTSQSHSDLTGPSERHLMPIIETVPKIHSPINSPTGSPTRHSSSTNSTPQNRSPAGGEQPASPPHVPSFPLEPSAPYLPPPQVQSFSVPEGIGRNANRRDSGGVGRLHLPFPGERSTNPFPGPGTGSKEVQGDWKLPPLREIYNGI